MRPFRSSGLVVFSILILLLAVLSLAMSPTVAEPGLPAISVTIEPIGEVETDLMEIVVVQATANISVTDFPLSALVHVTATTDRWAVVVNPSSFEVSQGSVKHNETVSVNIMVTPQSSAERILELKVVANTTTDLGVEYFGMAFTNISVKQYYGLRLSQNGTMAINQGENGTHRMRLTNTGNGADNYTVTLTNRTSLASKGLEVEFSEDIFILDEGRMTSVAIHVTAATDADIWVVMADFRVNSEGDPSRSKDYRITITVNVTNNLPVAIGSFSEDPDDLWTNMSIHFSSNESYDIDQDFIRFFWDFDDGSNTSDHANPVYMYQDPGTYTVKLTVTDGWNGVATDTLVLTVRGNYGDTDIVIKAVEPNTNRTFYDPAQGDIKQLAVMRGGWVAYLCDLRADQGIIVRITIFGDHPADLYLFEEVNFQTYKNNPQVTFVPFRADGYKQGATGVFNYSFTASETDNYYIIIDNKDWPMGTDSKGPVDYKISIDPTNPTPVAVASIQEDPDDLWTDLPINFSSTGSYEIEGEGRISFTWDFGDGTDPSLFANPVHAYEKPGTYTVTLTVHDKYNMISQETIVLTIQRNYGDSEIIIKAPIQEGRKFYDPAPEDIQQVAVMRDGWVAYLCDLRADQEMIVYIAIIGDHPADLYLFKEVDFQTYKNDPQVSFVPFEEEGSDQGTLGEIEYTFKAPEKDRYYIVIDNKDWPTGTDTEGPVEYTISIGPVYETPHSPPDPGDLNGMWILMAAYGLIAVFALVFFLDFFYKRSKE